MPYSNTIPAPGDLLSQSQADILNNFIAIGTVIDPNNGTVTLTQAVAPAPAATQMSLYTPLGANALHIKTAATDIDITTCGQAANGWGLLPCGIKMAWGTIAIPGGSTAAPGNNNLVLTNPTIPGFPGFTAVYNAQVTAIHAAGMDKYVWVFGLVPGSVAVRNPNSAAVNAYILVIGI